MELADTLNAARDAGIAIFAILGILLMVLSYFRHQSRVIEIEEKADERNSDILKTFAGMFGNTSGTVQNMQSELQLINANLTRNQDAQEIQNANMRAIVTELTTITRELKNNQEGLEKNMRILANNQILFQQQLERNSSQAVSNASTLQRIDTRGDTLQMAVDTIGVNVVESAKTLEGQAKMTEDQKDKLDEISRQLQDIRKALGILERQIRSIANVASEEQLRQAQQALLDQHLQTRQGLARIQTELAKLQQHPGTAPEATEDKEEKDEEDE